MDPVKRAEMLHRFKKDHNFAHHFFFDGRHPFASAPFHDELRADWYCDEPYVVQKAFRGAAKSTNAEEALALMACLGDFENAVIIRQSETRAKEALTAVKTIFSTNDRLIDFFGLMLGSVVTETKLVLSNNRCIQAIGKGQGLRGIKHNNRRPDLLLGDDMETDEDVRSPDAAQKFRTWWYGEVLPALQQPKHRVRVVGTPLADESTSLIERLVKNPNWRPREIPIKHYDENGHFVSAWPSLFPLAKIDALEEEYRREGLYETFAREYLVQATPKEGQTFEAGMFRVSPNVRTWQSVYAAFDPARTTSAQAAFTGWAVWSTQGSRLHVWEAGGAHLAPDAILDKIFETDDKYQPTFLGVEKDGLELFLMQPLRAEMLRRGTILPLRELKAPRDRSKQSFIEGLQPFAKAGEITLQEPMPGLIEQFTSFPRGRNDIINALAYALLMRGGSPVYDFDEETSVDESLSLNLQAIVYVLLNSNGAFCSAVACQYLNGSLCILNDWLAEGQPAEVFGDLLARVNVDVNTATNRRARVRYVAPARHFAQRDLVGLKAAAVRAKLTLGTLGSPEKGRVGLQGLLRSRFRGHGGVRIAPEASYTLRGLSGGYYRAASLFADRERALAEPNLYSMIFEAVEAFAASMQVLDAAANDENVRYAVAADGRQYITSRPY